MHGYPDNKENTQEHRRLPRTQHNLPVDSYTRKERSRNQQMEHEKQKDQEKFTNSQQKDKQSKLHWKLAEHAMPENRNKRHISDECRSRLNAALPKGNKLYANTGKIALLTFHHFATYNCN